MTAGDTSGLGRKNATWLLSSASGFWLAMALVALPTCARTGGRSPAWEDRIQLASGTAERGPWRQNESDFRWVDDPAVDIGPNGEAYVAWVDQSRKEVFFQRYGQDGRQRLPAPADISRSPDVFSWLPRLVVARSDPNQVFILWQEIVFSGGSHGGEIFFARSTDGSSFSSPANLSNSEAGDGKGRLSATTWDNGSLDLAEGPRGELHAAWTEYEGRLLFRRSTDRGQSFSEALHVGGGPGAPARGPSVGVGAAGAVHLAWSVGEDPSADIHVASSNDHGQSFGNARPVCESDGHSDAPKIAVDRHGTVHLVYVEKGARGSHQGHIRYSRMKIGTDRFEPPRALPGSSGDNLQRAHAPNLALDGRGRVYVLWEHHRGAEESPTGLAFSYSADGGERFASPVEVPGIAGPALGSNGSQQGALTKKLAVDAGGLIAIVNSTFREHRASHVWLLRGRLPQ